MGPALYPTARTSLGAALILTALALGVATAVPADTAASPAADERPAQTIAEPRRRSPIEQLPLLVAVTYGEAEVGVDRFPQALPELVDFIHGESRADILLRHTEAGLGDPRANGALVLHLTGNHAALHFTPPQRRWLGQYLRSGGLLYAEDVVPVEQGRNHVQGAGRPGTIFDVQIRDLLRHPAVLGQDGKGWQRIPDDHPLYSSFFPFPGAPPPSSTDQSQVDYLEMLEWRGRVVAILSELNISWSWASPRAPGRTRGLQFGTNLVVFALARRDAGPALRTP